MRLYYVYDGPYVTLFTHMLSYEKLQRFPLNLIGECVCIKPVGIILKSYTHTLSDENQ